MISIERKLCLRLIQVDWFNRIVIELNKPNIILVTVLGTGFTNNGKEMTGDELLIECFNIILEYVESNQKIPNMDS